MFGDEEFKRLYRRVRPIVMKLERLYYIKLWTRSDWEQEGMIILYQLCEACPEIVADEQKLFPYFKTKFSNYVTDTLRKQSSEKRRFNQMQYEEISEVGHALSDEGLLLEDYVAFKDWLRVTREGLTEQEQLQFDQLVRGERFVGRKSLLNKLRSVAKADS